MRKLPVFCLPRGMFGSRSPIAGEKVLHFVRQLAALAEWIKYKKITTWGRRQNRS